MEEFTSATRYGDLKGRVSFDRADNVSDVLESFRKHASVPPGFLLIGFQLRRLLPDTDGLIPFTVAAVDQRDGKNGIDAVREAAKRDGEVFALPFEGRIAPSQLAALFKRFNLTAFHRDLAHVKVLVDYDAQEGA